MDERASSRVDASRDAAATPPAREFLTAEEFTNFFRDVHGHEPFPWQQRLTAQVLRDGRWPKVIDLPTGTGKTAVLDTAVFTMAVRPESAPRRVVFVIDRRIVVDQVCERARRIRDRVTAAETPILSLIRERLGALSDGEPLGVAALRGGVPIDNEWTNRPDQPWVIVSTVDQFGSRLLFRGYGVSPGMRPVHAGLAGNDCLLILDEVHLSLPFAETLAQVAELRCGELPRRFDVVEMSATPSNTEAVPFTLDPVVDLEQCPELRRRVEAAKRAELVTVRDHDAMPSAILKIVKSIPNLPNLKPDDTTAQIVRSLGVVVNRVRTARETHQVLQEAGYATHLLTGRMRPLDRVDALGRIAPAVDPDGDSKPDELTVVVATQCIEVGADFSFDALATECAAVDSLRQRFGRLDRRGLSVTRNGTPAPAWIVGPKSVVASKKPDPIYGEAVTATWEELQALATRGPIDVGPGSLKHFPLRAAAPKAHSPLLLKTHLEAWTQTSPEPITQPAVESFLHGIGQSQTVDVSILWRWDRTEEALRLVPPRQAEFLQVPIDAAKSWLADADEVDVADVVMTRFEETKLPTNGNTADDWGRWEGFGKSLAAVDVSEIRPGDVIVVDPRRGGLRAGTWDPSCHDSVTDLGDAAQAVYGRRVTLRLDPRLLGGSVPRPSEEVDTDTSARERIERWLEECVEGNGPDWLFGVVEKLKPGFEITTAGVADDGYDEGYYVLIERNAHTQKPAVDDAVIDGSDETCSFTGSGVKLRDHLEGVGNRAACIANRLGLASDMVEDLRLAGQLHDLGKVDRRFQTQLVGGDPVALEMLEEPLAKSLPNASRVRRYPTGMRHEVASVAMAGTNADVLVSARDKDLVLHLVGTHHGFARPLPPIIDDPEPQLLAYTFDGHRMETHSDFTESSLALDMAERFWRLTERYGYHGLAWLEAILRLADHQQSAAEAEQA